MHDSCECSEIENKIKSPYRFANNIDKIKNKSIKIAHLVVCDTIFDICHDYAETS